MGFRFFRGERTRYEHEYRQLEEIVGILKKDFQKEPVYVLTNVLVANGQLDCVLLTRNGPLILELKAFSGEVRGLENGNWEVSTRDGPILLPNLFFKARNQRQDFIDRLIPIYRQNLPQVPENNLRKMSSWLYFSKGSRYPDGQIDLRKVKWFRVVTGDTLLDTMRFLDTGYTLRLQDMDAIVSGLHLQEYSFGNDRPVSLIPEPVKSRFRLSRGRIALLVILILVIGIAAAILTVPGARLAVSSMIQGIGVIVTGIIQAGNSSIIKSESSAGDSQAAIIYLNRMRVAGGVAPLMFDERAYHLALARGKDMAGYNYLDYTNPETGNSATAMKTRFGIAPNDTVLESIYGQWNGYSVGTEQLAVDAWTSDEGNRGRVFSNFDGAAVACSGGYCSFIGIVSEPVPDGNLSEAPVPPEVTAPPATGERTLQDS
jgi:uncharacterized protein YkwD